MSTASADVMAVSLWVHYPVRGFRKALEDIQSWEHCVSTKRPTMKDVALSAGVSTTTVSLVVRGDSQIPDCTAKRVHQAIKDVGYVYNRLAGNLRGGGATTFGILVTNPRNPYFRELIMAVEQALADSDDMAVSTFSLGGKRREAALATKLAGQGISGLMFMPREPYSDHDMQEINARLGIPVVQLIHDSAPAFDHVIVDEYAAGYLLGEHLAELNPDNLLFIGGSTSNSVLRQRVAGIQDGLAKHLPDKEIPVCEAAATNGNYEFSENLNLVADALDRCHKNLDGAAPDVVVCFNESYLVGALMTLRDRGFMPGDDVAVAAFGDLPVLSGPGFGMSTTVVNIHPEQFGLKALEVLRNRIADPDLPPQRAVIAPKLVVGDSTTRRIPTKS